ncbi:MAG: DUF4281 domain-containing protein [Deltaproteobacteria bacterium]|nr:MAG: DUF4281 domain-containing protein [Deltaproteobacteria bacterium]
MEASVLFKIANSIALVGWILMAVAPRSKLTDKVVHEGWLPLGFALLYSILFVTSFGTGQGNFSSLAGVKSLFSHDWIVLLGWVHYLCFDMLVGSWSLRDSWKRKIHHGFMVPILFATLMLGPFGYLLYRGFAAFFPLQTEPNT